MRQEDDDQRVYKVVVNHEEQYSIWLADREIPAGWRDAGVAGKKADCLSHIKEVWTDMRPLSLRLQMAELEKNPPPPPPPSPAVARRDSPVNELVERLQREQAIEASVRPEKLVKYFKEGLDRGLCFVTFVETGTELGVRLEAGESDLSGADFAAGRGHVTLVGTLTLNYNKVRFRGTIDLGSLSGKGRLEFIEAVRPGGS